tara:strand:+ start:3069 stop:3539 length:471 start_codon:yes stop_codon:yes gene_type:complete
VRIGNSYRDVFGRSVGASSAIRLLFLPAGECRTEPGLDRSAVLAGRHFECPGYSPAKYLFFLACIGMVALCDRGSQFYLVRVLQLLSRRFNLFTIRIVHKHLAPGCHTDDIFHTILTGTKELILNAFNRTIITCLLVANTFPINTQRLNQKKTKSN